MINDVKKSAEHKMQKTLETFKADLAKVRTGRAHTGLLDHVMVEYYGSDVPVNQVANVTLIDARTIGVQPWEKNLAGKIEKAIRDCDLGLNPASMGDLIRVPMPMLTEERRKEYIKVVKTKAEDSKISMRNIRRAAKEAMEKLEKDGDIGKDDLARGEKELEKITADHVAKIDELLKHKEVELLEV